MNKKQPIFRYFIALLTLVFLPCESFASDVFLSEICNVYNIVIGNGGKAFAAFAIVSVGIGFFTGKVSWGLMVGVTVGIATTFGAPSIVSAISGKETFVCEEKTYNSDCINGPCSSCPNGRTGVTCQDYLPGYTSNGCDEAAGYIKIGDACYQNCSLASNGITPRTVNHAANQSLACSAANFTGNLIYTCSNGKLTINNNSCACIGNFTGASCNSCTAGYLESSSCTACASNYAMIEGFCQKDCTTSSELVGISSGIKLIGNGTIPCNSPYSKTIDYSCVGGNLNFSSTCDSCMANYEMVDGVCQAVNCSVPSTVGTTTTTVNLGTGTLPCNSSGYSGEASSYSCSGGTFTVIAKNCFKTEFFTTAGSFTWTVPPEWDSSNNSIEVIGGGGGGGAFNSNGGGGGGGGAYSKTTNLALTPGTSISYKVGSGGSGGIQNSNIAASGGDTWFNGSTFAESSVGAKGGNAGTSSGVASGGSSSNGIGNSTKSSGGSGGSAGKHAGGGGGGAGGKYGNGGNGGNFANASGGGGGGGGGGSNGGVASSDSSSGAGGNGTTAAGGASAAGNGTSGANGSSSSDSSGGGGSGGNFGRPAGSGGNGGAGKDLHSTYGSGGGGGGAGDQDGKDNSSAVGGAGGNYGAGGGGAGEDNNVTGGAGAQGIIMIRY